jgi:hypothetical protein
MAFEEYANIPVIGEQELQQQFKQAADEMTNELVKTQGQESENETQVSENNFEPELDNQSNNPYIGNSQQGTASVDPTPDPNDKVLAYYKNTFGGDPLSITADSPVYKALKSNMETQSAYAKRQNELNQLKPLEGYFAQLETALQRNPQLELLLDRALKGEPLENLSVAPSEPMGKPMSAGGKLEGVADEVSAEMMISAGYLDRNRYDQATELERAKLMASATMNYLPKVIAQRTAVEIQAAEQTRQQQLAVQNAQTENSRRYENSFQNAVIHGFDFAGNPEHAALLPEIQRQSVAFRDPDNTNLIHPDAVQIAAERIATQKGIRIGSTTRAIVNPPGSVTAQQNIQGGKDNASKPLTEREKLYLAAVGPSAVNVVNTRALYKTR